MIFIIQRKLADVLTVKVGLTNIFFLITVISCGSVFASFPQDFNDSQLEYFEKKVRPLLVEHCYDCHGSSEEPVKGGLSLLSRQALLEGGETGPAILPGHPDQSLLIDAINYGDVYEMPPDTKMSDEDIATIEKWVAMGAPWPAEPDTSVNPQETFNLQSRRQDHWSWQPVRSQLPPRVKNSDWANDSIDRFILAKLEAAQLEPAPPADRRTLIRRLYFDLIGLPPTPEQVQAYLKDPSPQATAKVVDELLASERFGERWARHWMDLTRYAETCGHEFDYPLPHAFQYRDYLIRALNADVPYDQFIREHIAGDLLKTPRHHPTEKFNESVLGTGFWFLGEATHGPVDVKGDEAGRVDNQVDVMTKSFQGLTVACARCHDHKFDAISTEDYYALSGYLQSSRRQLAMLDPKLKIGQARQASQQALRKAERLLPKIQGQIREIDPDKMARTIESALQVLRHDPQWNQPAGLKLQGESLKATNQPSGKIEVQNLAPRGEYRWEGDKQFFWIDGKPGEQVDFDITIPDSGTDEFAAKLNVHFTRAGDYANLQVLLDDQPVGQEQNLFDQEVTVQLREVGQVLLKPGKHKLSFQITGKNEAAKPRHVVGIDFVEFSPIVKVDESSNQRLRDLAEKNQVDVDQIERWVAAIKSESLKSPEHPLHVLQQASREQQAIDQGHGKHLQDHHRQQVQRYEEYLDQTESFESFEQGIPADWFLAGAAFDRADQDGSVSAADSVLVPQGIANGGKYGREFFGVLYSPTFEIGTDQIHIRARGDQVSIRLIIDGFVMDVFNGLLFNGCRTNLNNASEFRWYTLAGDLRNYQGHRAHLEVIDHGHGFAEIDEVRFSDRGPVALPGRASAQLAKDAPADLPALARSLADYLVESAVQCRDDDDSRSLGFLLQNRLVELPSQVATGSAADGDRETDPLIRFDKYREQAMQAASKAPAPQMAVAMIDGTGEDEFVFVRGNHKTLGAVAQRRFLEALNPEKTGVASSAGSGRSELADTIASPENPLTSRVAVNRVWHHMLGKGIVPSVDNFGVLGQSPSHPELLDYLAAEFVADQWSIKRLIRRIALSQTYQMSSTMNADAEEQDPSNRWLHRAPIKRLQGESIRDAILACTGELDTTMYGPSVPIHLTSFMSGRGRPGRNGPLDGNRRRSVYIEVRRNFLSPMMLAFDTPIPFNTIGRRNQSNVPAQALILLNDPFVMDQAKKWGEKLAGTQGTLDEKISSIYRTTLGREPTEEELGQSRLFLQQQAKELGVGSDDALANAQVWADFCHVMFNVKEFIYLY
ncbi:MAG: PSD1 and planctomycete cytochrome C domain-containing protein [Mariniblastus sp.]|nr:PSD1 and planctomycete cytochrome C domain-containing protein [Mariniblastus sp.]